MLDKQLLIIGIDPGTTLGYAAIDFEGNLVKVHSEKEVDMGTLISEIVNLGKPLIVAGDKKYTPGFVEKLAIKLGARLIGPDYDLKVIEKRDAVRKYETGNQHEIDALASAVFALKKLTPLLNKINVFVQHYKKENIKNQLIEFVVGKELNIKDAAEIIEEQKIKDFPISKSKDFEKPEKEERKLTEKDFLVLYKRFKDAQKDIRLLREQNKRLEDKTTAIKRDYEYMFKQISRSQLDKKMQSLLDFKEGRIKFFANELNKKQLEIKSMRGEVTNLLYFLSNIGSSVLLKKLDNLGINEFEKKRNMLNIKQGDVLLVRDPDIVSDKTISEIKDKVHVILYKKPVSKKIESRLPFIFINSAEVKIEENEYFGIADRADFEKMKNKKSLLHKIVEDYRSERS
ncbi:MAG: DUF460 domain-containing protein [Nanoarchaeota archaeon]|nr:DUF460 domain-containing protein [Nanoarchaeota archaeon]MBU1004197.1 DUF460 domain-containing protein [Nanoarchaeota archaeon]MBU1945351.1 DUF460 domain-containing protein [Nanoarchaeota archaeon]